MKRFHTIFFNRLAGAMLSVGAFYVLTIGVIIGLIDQSALPIVQLLSSSWYQAVALPLVAITGAAAAYETMQLIRETHDIVVETLGAHGKRIEELHDKHDAAHPEIAE